MAANLNKTRGLIYSQQSLLALTRAGMSREDAYALVQAAAMRCWAGEGDFLDLLAGTPEVAAKIPREDLARFFDPEALPHPRGRDLPQGVRMRAGVARHGNVRSLTTAP